MTTSCDRVSYHMCCLIHLIRRPGRGGYTSDRLAFLECFFVLSLIGGEMPSSGFS